MNYLVMEFWEWLDAMTACIPGRIGRLWRGVYWRMRLKRLGRKPSIGLGFRVLGPENISIGRQLYSTGQTFLAAEKGSILIHDSVAFNNNVHVNASLGGEIEIGSHTMIGPNCVLRASDHVFDDPDLPIQFQGHTGGSIVLEEDVWLGANVVVVSGVRIGKGSVVAAGAVVTKDVEPGSVVGGVPARLIKMRDAAELTR